jgi:hypothetical protein
MAKAIRTSDLVDLRWTQLRSPHARQLLLAAECAPDRPILHRFLQRATRLPPDAYRAAVDLTTKALLACLLALSDPVLAEKCHPCRDQPLPPLGYPFGGPNATGLAPLRPIPLVQGLLNSPSEGDLHPQNCCSECASSSEYALFPLKAGGESDSVVSYNEATRWWRARSSPLTDTQAARGSQGRPSVRRR